MSLLAYSTEQMREKEARILAMLRDPHLVLFLGVTFIREGTFSLVMEYMAHGDILSFRKRCEEKRIQLPPDMYLYIASSIARGKSNI